MARDDLSGYYDAGGIEVLDAIKAKLTPEQYKGYLLGNSIKYALRSNFKGTFDRDIEKLANYSKWLGEMNVETKTTTPSEGSVGALSASLHKERDG